MNELLIFTSSDNLFAVDAGIVEEILDPQLPTPIPNQTPMVEGLINVHGKIALLLNFHSILNNYSPNQARTQKKSLAANRLEPEQAPPSFPLPPQNTTPKERNIILINNNSITYGINVEKVLGKVIASHTIKKEDSSSQGNIPCIGQFLHEGQPVIIVSFDEIITQTLKLDESTSKNIFSGKGLSFYREGTDKKNNLISLLTTEINNHFFAISIEDVQEVILLSKFTPVPFLPNYVVGISNLRGMPIVTISLPHFLGEPTNDQPYRYGLLTKYNGGLLIMATYNNINMEHFDKKQCYFAQGNGLVTGWTKKPDQTFAGILDIKRLLQEPTLTEIENLLTPLNDDQEKLTNHKQKRYLIIKAADEYFGICLDDVNVIVDELSIQPLPTPEQPTKKNTVNHLIKGIAQVHGNILYALDTYVLFNKEEATTYKNYIVAQVGEKKFILPIQNVENVITISDTQIETLGPSDTLVHQVAKTDNKIVSIINTKNLLKYLPTEVI